MRMPRTTVDIDLDALRDAQDALNTTGTSATVNAALREAARRAQLAGFDVLALPAFGTPADIEAGRDDRGHPDG